MYKYNIDDKLLNMLTYSKVFNNKAIFTYIFELLYDIFEINSIDSHYFENKAKGILGSNKNVVTSEIIDEQMEYIGDGKYLPSFKIIY